MKTLIETLSDGTQNYMVDLGDVGMLFMSVFKGEPMLVESWACHIEAYPVELNVVISEV